MRLIKLILLFTIFVSGIYVFADSPNVSNPNLCATGGVAVNDTSNASYCAVPEGFRVCGGDGFLCGRIYGKNTCVKRDPQITLSERCYKMGKTMSPSNDDFKVAEKEYKPYYNSLCGSDISDKSKAGCYFSSAQIVEAKKGAEWGISAARVDQQKSQLPTGSSISIPTAPAPTIAVAHAPRKPAPVIATATLSDETFKGPDCPGDHIEGVPSGKKKKGLVQDINVPVFGMDEDSLCVFQRNKTLLAEVSKNGCNTSAKKVGDQLMTTLIHPKGQLQCNFSQDCYDAIIENVELVEKDSGLYNIQMLRTNPNFHPVEIFRTNINVRKKDGKYYLIGTNGTDSTEIAIDNTVRNDLIGYHAAIGSDQSALDKIHDSKMALSNNCVLSNALHAAGMYSSGVPASSGTTK